MKTLPGLFWAIAIFMAFCKVANAQENWAPVEWRNTYSTVPSQQYISVNSSDLSEANKTGFLFIYSAELKNVLQGILIDKPYLGFLPTFGSRVGCVIRPGLIADSLILLRDGNQEKVFPIEVGDSVSIHLTPGYTQVKINSNSTMVNGFGGFTGNNTNEVRLECHSVFEPMEVYFSEPAFTNTSGPYFTVNGVYSEAQVWDLCPGEAIFVRAIGYDVVLWRTDATNCLNCPSTMVLDEFQGELELAYTAYNFLQSRDSVTGSLLLRMNDSEITIPEAIYFCEGDQVELNVQGASTVSWFPQNGVNFSCNDCSSTQVKASRSSAIGGIASAENGCEQEISIPFYKDSYPDLNYQLAESIGAANRPEIKLKSEASRLHHVFWRLPGGDPVEDRRFTLDYFHENITLIVESSHCGMDSTVIPLNYPAITPLNVSVDYLDSATISYQAQPFNCTDCTVSWLFGDGNASQQWTGTYNYGTSGKYELVLKVVDRLGREVSRKKIIYIQNQ